VGLTPAGAAFIDRFRELNARQMRELLEHLADDELELVRQALGALSRVAAQLTVDPLPASRKDPA
jgi:DNA-binding MarR family transcriptional regulator